MIAGQFSMINREVLTKMQDFKADQKIIKNKEIKSKNLNPNIL